ncbi:hypothetical protein [Nitrosopumilus maritimus]|uniref:hypothetical protein n=1 Tax=Nitrosopumilus maritimus TaxID=338192 RepID=UPI000159AEFB|nr:hypothetical protein [Nitrosopumilus maritimus]
MPLRIRYKFKGDPQSYSCAVTYPQYINFRNLSAIDECEITNKDEVLQQSMQNEIEEALYMACKNELTPIKKLSCPEKYV